MTEIRYAPTDPSYPALERCRPIIPAEWVQDANGPRPDARPSHCKPWLDAESLGVLWRYPYPEPLTITGAAPGELVQLEGALADETASRFVPGFFSLGSGYLLETDEPYGLLTAPVPFGLHSKAVVQRGLVETWWYPKPPFVVFAAPAEGFSITLEQGDPLCSLLPVPCDQQVLRTLTDAEFVRHQERGIDYWKEATQRRDLLWFSRLGQGFSRLYKERSRGEHRRLDERL